MHRTARFGVAMLALLALSSGLAACGDDDENDEALARYCDKTAEIETIGEPPVDFQNASEEEIREGLKAFGRDELLPIADEIVANAPEEVEEDIDVLYNATKEIAETGNPEIFESEKVKAAGNRLHAHDLDACDWKRIAVTAKDYAFEGIDAELDPGITSFEFTNEGKEVHELAVIRKNDGVTESFDEILSGPEEQARTKTTGVGGAFGEPGDHHYALVDLKPGEYIALCFISVGTTSEKHEGDGPPHFTKGMKREFTVS